MADVEKSMKDAGFTIGAEGFDAESLVEEIRQAVQQKADQGLYADARIARAERTNLANLRNDADFLSFYLKSLREAAFVDINDFEIRERRARFSKALVKLKKTIWNLLKFYTYRLWSQQNSVNGLMVTGLESLEETYRDKIERLEARVAELEKRLPPGGPAS